MESCRASSTAIIGACRAYGKPIPRDVSVETWACLVADRMGVYPYGNLAGDTQQGNAI